MVRTRGVAVSLVLATFLIVGTQSGRADETNDRHPVHIYAGSCVNPGDVAAPLTDIGPSLLAEGTPSASDHAVGSATANPVEASVTSVNMALSQIADGNHAVNVDLSPEDIGEDIACGDVGGRMMGADLAIGLAELNNSGYSGIAWLHDNGDGTTTVHVFLTEKTEEIGAESTLTAADNVNVTLNDFTVTPSQTTFKVGVPYTFTIENEGKALHELVIEKATDVDVPLQDSGHQAEAEDIDPGATKTLEWTFMEPGEYQLACHRQGHFEDGMYVTIEVSS